MADLGSIGKIQDQPINNQIVTYAIIQGGHTGTERWSGLKFISGTIKDDTDVGTSRVVKAYDRSTGELRGVSTSNTLGVFSIQVSEAVEHTIICYDDIAGTSYNALIFDKVVAG